MFYEVTLECVRLHARRRGHLPRPAGQDGPYTSDALLHSMHCESPYDVFDATSEKLATGLDNLAVSLDGQLPNVHDKLVALWLACSGATRFGGIDYVERFLAHLCKHPLPLLRK